jgi:single-stranded-DNA-specific exonuclease
MRSGKAVPGIRALLHCAGRNAALIKASDLAFYIGPRINAAGRLQHMALGIDCLLAEDDEIATQLAQSLEEVNTLRKERQAQAVEQAIAVTPRFPSAPVLIAFDPEWHEGIVGLVAGRLKEAYHRPAFAFAPALTSTLLKGSGRSVPGLHLRDMLDFVSKQAPEVFVSFGGHAMAAGVTIHAEHLDRFENCVDAAARHFLVLGEPGADPLNPIVWTDGSSLGPRESPSNLLELAAQIEQQVWGQGFPEPLFDDEFDVLQCELLGNKHMKMAVRFAARPSLVVKAMRFFSTDAPPAKARMLYRLSVNRWNGKSNVELQITHVIH